jgi:hypothetical protein
MDQMDGITEGVSEHVNAVEGVYDKSYFDLQKYPTHWKLVGLLFLFSYKRLTTQFMEWIVGLD